MYNNLKPILESELAAAKENGTYKVERVLESAQGREIKVGRKKYLNFCANNYLGLSGTELLEKASEKAVKKWGFGLASVRFICGTQTVHKDLERAVAGLVGAEDAVLYSSCFMANVGLFQTFFGAEDVIISDELNHASIIDAVRLSKASREIYKHMDMNDLEEKLKASAGKRLRVIATDGVYSMDGDIAPLKEICDLADKYDALVMVDDAHATGVMGKNGGGTPEHCGVVRRVDFITGTFGKALGGAGGAFIATRKEAAEYLRNRSRAYLFSNSLDTAVAGTSLFVINHLKKHPEFRERLWENTKLFRELMKKNGFAVPNAQHPITPIMLGDEKKAVEMAKALFDEGIYVIGFAFPVVPKGKARIRVQISAAHTKEDIESAVEKFTKVGKKFGVV
ncbi:MAG: 2-amino-3-ketobutyrate coenzyme A ligase [Candidatus Kaiserbacteria bacterium GW2011_GWA2_49_19]|uniref:8-amino-7-oxononanoate synthase n=2 Tax=Candidatus Kaiseribacteriota TaxID=1752734 RepID=A0A0G1VSD1_9BACT|nr:MAG: 2-amino-3-ketobutyrate coenzyme A ligase [Candidatus Kaiserbacteria bacterium GW2011_GWA2_49_19]OGG60714.1 MAG: glycine C-acetyltransferase [Candidatus Kaiserbacteria bacterium RIFCSPHIGHO2_02_FULL_49_16]